MNGIHLTGLPTGPDFWAKVAQKLLDEAGASLPTLTVIVPNLRVIPLLSVALGKAAGTTVWLPRMDTLSAVLSPFLAQVDAQHPVHRQLAVYEALRARAWFGDANLWAVSDELIALFDELTLSAQNLPPSEDALRQLLVSQYRVAENAALNFEAQFTHSLWQAESQGLPSHARARLLAAQAWVEESHSPIWVVAEGALSPLERHIYTAYAAHQPVRVLWPDRFAGAARAQRFNEAWPQSEQTAPPAEVALDKARAPENITPPITLAPADSLEDLATHVALTVQDWLNQGMERIALVAVDRLAARRVHALLAREGIVVDDETGWAFTTTRVAAFIDSLLRVLVEDAYYTDMIDLVRSAYACADLPTDERTAGAWRIEQTLQARQLISGLDALEAALHQTEGNLSAHIFVQRLKTEQAALLGGQAGHARMRPKARTVSDWLAWLQGAVRTLGAHAALEADSAGQQWLAWVEDTRTRLATTSVSLSLSEWRSWLDDQMEALMFVPERQASKVVLTHLPACRLRVFDAVILMGADEHNLVPSQPRAVFAHDGVRQALGLSTQRVHRARLREDLAWLGLTAPHVMLAWQAWDKGETRLLAPDWALLESVCRRAQGHGFAHAQPFAPLSSTHAPVCAMPAPAIPPGLRPATLSASAYQSLLACPYQYFARTVLRLNAEEGMEETLSKRTYGQRIHALLYAFHTQHPQLTNLAPGVAEEALLQLTQQYFETEVTHNYFEMGWLLRWQRMLAHYVDWQRARERAGWFFAQGESAHTHTLALATGALTLKGRIDRIDRNAQAHQAVLDYKLGQATRLKENAQNPEDVQLAFYTLLTGAAVNDAAYVALDDAQGVQSFSVDNPQQHAQAHAEHITHIFEALDQAAPLPANGQTGCVHCEMAGICRKDYWATG